MNQSSNQTGNQTGTQTGTVRNRIAGRLRALRATDQDHESTGGGSLAARVTALEAAVEENRKLNQRLADVVDVVTEVLVPAVDRDDTRLRAALENLGKTLDS